MDEQAQNTNESTNEKPKKPLPKEAEPYKWQPGQSGNPGGRPKKKPISELYERLMDDPAFMEQVEASIRKMVASGRMVGQLQLKEMAERVEGKITQPVEVEVNVILSERLKKARERRSE